MSKADAEVDRALSTLLDYLNNEDLKPGEWAPQVNIVTPEEVTICVIENGLPDDPIESLVKFGREKRSVADAEAVSVIAATTPEELMISAADAGRNIALAYVCYREGAWSIGERYKSSQLVKTPRDRIPAAAVWRGMKGKQAT